MSPAGYSCVYVALTVSRIPAEALSYYGVVLRFSSRTAPEYNVERPPCTLLDILILRKVILFRSIVQRLSTHTEVRRFITLNPYLTVLHKTYIKNLVFNS
jgi:hypothetical protein